MDLDSISFHAYTNDKVLAKEGADTDTSVNLIDLDSTLIDLNDAQEVPCSEVLKTTSEFDDTFSELVKKTHVATLESIGHALIVKEDTDTPVNLIGLDSKLIELNDAQEVPLPCPEVYKTKSEFGDTFSEVVKKPPVATLESIGQPLLVKEADTDTPVNLIGLDSKLIELNDAQEVPLPCPEVYKTESEFGDTFSEVVKKPPVATLESIGQPLLVKEDTDTPVNLIGLDSKLIELNDAQEVPLPCPEVYKTKSEFGDTFSEVVKKPPVATLESIGQPLLVKEETDTGTPIVNLIGLDSKLIELNDAQEVPLPCPEVHKTKSEFDDTFSEVVKKPPVATLESIRQLVEDLFRSPTGTTPKTNRISQSLERRHSFQASSSGANEEDMTVNFNLRLARRTSDSLDSVTPPINSSLDDSNSNRCSTPKSKQLLLNRTYDNETGLISLASTKKSAPNVNSRKSAPVQSPVSSRGRSPARALLKCPSPRENTLPQLLLNRTYDNETGLISLASTKKPAPNVNSRKSAPVQSPVSSSRRSPARALLKCPSPRENTLPQVCREEMKKKFATTGVGRSLFGTSQNKENIQKIPNRFGFRK